MLPFTLIGVFVLIGVLGFTPFLTALVFLRNAVRAVRSARAKSGEWPGAATLGFIIAFAPPAAAEWYVARLAERCVRQVNESALGEAGLSEGTIVALRWISWLDETELDAIVRAYDRERDGDRRQRLADIYFRATGRDIELRLGVLND